MTPQQEKETIDRIEQLMYVKVHDEIERWKSVHDEEFTRRRKWTWMSATFSLLAVFGVGVSSFNSFVQNAVDRNQEPYFALLNNMTNKVEKVANDAIKDAKNAREHATLEISQAANETTAELEKARKQAALAADQAGKQVRAKLIEITESAKKGAITKLINASVEEARAKPTDVRQQANRVADYIEYIAYRLAYETNGNATNDRLVQSACKKVGSDLKGDRCRFTEEISEMRSEVVKAFETAAGY